METPLVLLAAGASSRFQGDAPKALYRGSVTGWISSAKPLVLRQLEQFRAVGGKSASVVLGHHLERFFSEIPDFKQACEKPVPVEGIEVRVIINARPERGPFSSLQLGISSLAPDASAFILPVDVPGAEMEVWRAIEKAKGYFAVVPISPSGRGGHPVWLSSEFLRELRAYDLGDIEGARLDRRIQALDPALVLRVQVEDEKVSSNLNF